MRCSGSYVHGCAWMSNNRTCEVLLSDGERLRGPVHASWAMIESHPEVTTLDLHAAYKQLAISPSSRAFSVVVLSNFDSGNLGCFVGHALPFGSTDSVVYFNQIVRLIWRLGLELLLPWCNYYDYPVFTAACLAPSSMSAMIARSCEVAWVQLFRRQVAPLWAEGRDAGC